MTVTTSALAVLTIGGWLAASAAAGQAGPSPAPSATPTPAPTPSPSPGPGSKPPPSKAVIDGKRALDSAFITRATLAAMQEVELSRIAAERASNGDARALGHRLIDERGKDRDELNRLAQKAGFDLPAALDGAGKSEVERLSRLSSPALEAAYVSALLARHDAEVEAFRTQVKAGQEVELQGWVAVVLPLLEDQQKAIHALASALQIPAK